ncbi:MAG: hypothetical protein P8L18_03405 [Verrucomicrobiota bacterium]|nr:hypothetical protein [Verrucomicrobiota bacterium]
MQHLQKLVDQIDLAPNASVKLDALKSYFQSVPPEDAAWALFFLEERKLCTKVGTRLLKELITSETGLPAEMIDGSNAKIHDLPETLALMLPWNGRSCELSLSTLIIQFVEPLAGFAAQAKRETIRCAWKTLSTPERILFNKLLVGKFQIGIAREMVHKALGEIGGISPGVISHRLASNWPPDAGTFQRLIQADPENDLAIEAYPLHEAMNLEGRPETLGKIENWVTEWALRGVRAQLTRRKDAIALWSKKGITLKNNFPELLNLSQLLPTGTVMDGVILLPLKRHRDIANLPKKPSQKNASPSEIRAHETPVFVVHDLLEYQGNDIRQCSFTQRRTLLEQLIQDWKQQWLICRSNLSTGNVNPDCMQQEMFSMSEIVGMESTGQVPMEPVRASHQISADSWQGLRQCLLNGPDDRTKGMILKQKNASYPVQEHDTPWWQWKPAPNTVHLVLVSALRNTSGHMESLSEYHFGALSGQEWPCVAKTSIVVREEDRREMDKWILSNTLRKQGPLRHVQPQMIFELTFDQVVDAPRSHSQIKLTNARVIRHAIELNLENTVSLGQLLSKSP